jgi:hypothetical protein
MPGYMLNFTFYFTHLVTRNNKLGYASVSLHHNHMSFSNDILLIREVGTVKTTGLLIFAVIIKYKEGRDSVVSIATRCGLDGSGFEHRCI